MNTISPEKLAELEALTLDRGAHEYFTEGHCAMEVVAWLADEGHTDAPTCASPILRRYTIALNDRWADEKRQTLKPYLLRMIGTGNDGLDPTREQILLEWTGKRLLGPWLRLAKLDAESDRVEAAETVAELRSAVRAASDAAWAARSAAMDKIEAKVREHLADKTDVAVAVAADVAIAADIAVVIAAAVAIDAAAAIAVAADIAVAAAAVIAAPHLSYSAAYMAARDYYRTHPLLITEQAAELAAKQDPLALELLDALISPTK